MSNPFKAGDWAELIAPINGKKFQPGTRGQVYATSYALVGLYVDNERTREIVGPYDNFKKLSSNKLFPVKHRIIEA
jgi:hypothetical protein